MPTETRTFLSDLINPQVMADMISAKITNALVVTPFAKIDTTLQGTPGNTVTVPKYTYIGDAEDVAEGVACGTTVLASTTESYTVKKAMKAINLTDEAIASGFGNPVGEANSQLAKSIASKIDSDAISALLTSSLIHTAGAPISYAGIVRAIDLFNEEVNTKKVVFIHPSQLTELRLDPNFISADKYTGDVVMTGEVGRIANCSVVPSRRVTLSNGAYACPIVKVEENPDTEDEVPALTIYLKSDTNVETERNTLERTTDISVDKHYIAALTNDSKVVVAKFTSSEVVPLAFVSEASASAAGKTALSGIDPAKGTGESYVYQTGIDLPIPTKGAILTGSAWTAWNGSAEIAATTGHDIVLAIIDSTTSACKAAGKTKVVSKAAE